MWGNKRCPAVTGTRRAFLDRKVSHCSCVSEARRCTKACATGSSSAAKTPTGEQLSTCLLGVLACMAQDSGRRVDTCCQRLGNGVVPAPGQPCSHCAGEESQQAAYALAPSSGPPPLSEGVGAAGRSLQGFDAPNSRSTEVRCGSCSLVRPQKVRCSDAGCRHAVPTDRQETPPRAAAQHGMGTVPSQLFALSDKDANLASMLHRPRQPESLNKVPDWAGWLLPFWRSSTVSINKLPTSRLCRMESSAWTRHRHVRAGMCHQ